MKAMFLYASSKNRVISIIFHKIILALSADLKKQQKLVYMCHRDCTDIEIP